MFEDLESIVSATHLTEGLRNSISIDQAEYINECVEGGNISALIDRIDELSLSQPPKGVDSDRSVAELIEPVKEQIDSKYLEAPNDSEQISQISDFLSETSGLQYENWRNMDVNERLEVLMDAENKIAEIEHRPFCNVKCEHMEPNEYGYYSSVDKSITFSFDMIASNSLQDFKQSLDTLIHEGRHAYQDYNMNEREVHSRAGEVNIWRWNENDIGYQDWRLHGIEAYAMQPIETDVRAFSEDVLSNYFQKIA